MEPRHQFIQRHISKNGKWALSADLEIRNLETNPRWKKTMRREKRKRQQLRRSASRPRKKSVKRPVKKNSKFSKEQMQGTKVATVDQVLVQPVRSPQLRNSKENKRRSKLNWKKRSGMLKNWRQKKEVSSNKKLLFSNKNYSVWWANSKELAQMSSAHSNLLTPIRMAPSIWESSSLL